MTTATLTRLAAEAAPTPPGLSDLTWGGLTMALYHSDAPDALLEATDLTAAEIRALAAEGIARRGAAAINRAGRLLDAEAHGAVKATRPGQLTPSYRERAARLAAARLTAPPSPTALSERVHIS